jgi:hypothetical protein
VVGVEQEAAPRVVPEDHVRPHDPDQPGHGQAHGHGDLQLAVDRPQEVDRDRGPEGSGGRLGLGPPDPGQLGLASLELGQRGLARVGRRIGAALLPGGEAGQLHVHPPPGPGGQGPPSLELDVVRMRAEGQDPTNSKHQGSH